MHSDLHSLAEQHKVDPEGVAQLRARLASGLRDDYCGCAKDEGTYGEHGWHWRINPDFPGRKADDVAVERCSRYSAAVEAAAKGPGLSPEQIILEKAGVPRAYLGCSLSSWRGSMPVEVKRYAGECVGFILLIGSPGRGKTHLATAIAREAVKRDIEVVWRDVPGLLSQAKRDFAWGDRQMEALRYADLAILDDIGGERGTEYDLAAIAEVVRERHAQGWPTVATTNLSMDVLQERDGRIASRLASGVVVELGGRDRRLAP